MNYMKILDCDVANGLGWRVSLFVSGCTLHCKGCFNKEAWDFCHGKPFTVNVQNKILELLHPDYIQGLSILGGNPTEPENEKELIPFVKRVKEYYPDKDIWLWTGHTMEELVPRKDELIWLCDVVIDGRFEEDKKDTSLAFKGSGNQRMWANVDGNFVLVKGPEDLNPVKCVDGYVVKRREDGELEFSLSKVS